MKKFLKQNWTLILVLLYFISPDLLPGPLDDITLLFAELGRRFLFSIIRQLKGIFIEFNRVQVLIIID